MHFELILILLSTWNYKMDCCWKSKSFFRTNTKRSDGEEKHRLKCLLLCLGYMYS